MLKKIIIIILALGLIAGGILLVKKRKMQVASAKTPVKPVYKFETSKVKFGEVEKSKKVLAQILPDKKVIISSKIIAYVKKVYFNAGDNVKKGDIIAEIDDTNIKLAIKNLNNQLDSLKFQKKALKSEFEYIKEKYKRDKILFKSGAISEEEFQKSESNFNNIKNSILSLDKKINSLFDEIKSKKHDLTYTKILSPFNGTISKEFLKKGSLVGIGTPIIEIVSKNNYKIVFQLPSNEAKEIDETSFIEMNVNNELQQLKIQKIYPKTGNNSLVVLESRIKTLPPNIPSNSYTSIKVVFYKKSGLISPNNSILKLSNGEYLLKKTNNSLKKIKISVFFCDEKHCLIKSDEIKQGDDIVTGSENKLRLLIF